MTTTATTASPIFDRDLLDTDAVRALNAARPRLQKAIDEVSIDAAEDAMEITKLRMIDLILAAEPNTPVDARAKKDDIAGLYITVMTGTCDAKKELNRLERLAHADDWFVRQVNAWQEEADEHSAWLREQSALTLAAASSELVWKMNRVHVAAELSRIGTLIITALTRGNTDLPGLVQALTEEKIVEMMRIPRQVLSNGVGGTHRSSEVYAAEAARQFVQQAGQTYAFIYPDNAVFLLARRV